MIGGGGRTLSCLFTCSDAGEWKIGLDSYRTLSLIYEYESKFWLWWNYVYYHAHTFAAMLPAPALVLRNAIKGGISDFSFSNKMSWQYNLWDFFGEKKKTFISPTFVCTFNLHIKEIPLGPALHIYIWLVTLNEHVKNGRVFFFECARTT